MSPAAQNRTIEAFPEGYALTESGVAVTERGARELYGLVGTERVIRRPLTFHVSRPTQDIGRVDYRFLDALRRGKAPRLEIAGALAKPVSSKIASYVLGDPVGWKVVDDPDLEERLNQWMERWHSTILSTYQESLDLADAFLIFNGDGTLTAKSPDVAELIVDPDNYSIPIGWRFREVYTNPGTINDTMTIVDEYYADRRVLRIERPGRSPQVETFGNPLGMIPVIHIPNNRSPSEVFGRSEIEGVLRVFLAYNQVMEAAIFGNIRQGRPTPVFSQLGGQAEVDLFWEKFGKKVTITLPDGSTRVEEGVAFDADQVVTLPGMGKFSWESPGSFAGDVEKILGLLFYLYVQHVEVPEFALGNAIASSKASAEAQEDPFARFNLKKRGQAQGWLVYTATLYMRYDALVNGRVFPTTTPTPIWQPLTQEDQKTILAAAQLARNEGAIDRVTLLENLPLQYGNAEDVIARAQAELQADREAARDPMEDTINQLLNTPAEDNAPEGEPPDNTDF